MAAQPLNADISVRYNIRSYRSVKRSDTVAAGIYRLRPLNVAVPGIDGIKAEVQTRDTSKADFSPYASAGFPIVYGLHGETSFKDMVDNIAGAGFAFKIGTDKFIPQADSALEDDMYGSAKTVDDTYAAV